MSTQRARVECETTENAVKKLITPLQPRDFFKGLWTGDGELIPHFSFRWVLPKERIRLRSEAVWLSESVWIVKDRFEFSSGRIVQRKMFAELVGPDRIHVTADDMPGGADILLRERGFRFTPYLVLAQYGGRLFQLKCLDECRLDEAGFLHDTVHMFFWGFPVMTLRLGPITREA